MPVERIENLPAGIRLFLDANIFVYAFLDHSNQCRELLGRCATEQVLGITILDVVNEVTHRMMLAEALGSGLIKRDRVRDLRGKWREIAQLTKYWTQTLAIFGLNVLVLMTDEARLHRAQAIRARHGLLTVRTVAAQASRVAAPSQFLVSGFKFRVFSSLASG